MCATIRLPTTTPRGDSTPRFRAIGDGDSDGSTTMARSPFHTSWKLARDDDLSSSQRIIKFETAAAAAETDEKPS